MKVKGSYWMSYESNVIQLRRWMDSLEVGDPKIAKIETVIDNLNQRRLDKLV